LTPTFDEANFDVTPELNVEIAGQISLRLAIGGVPPLDVK